MKQQTNYQKAKAILKDLQKDNIASGIHKTDKPMARMLLNDIADNLVRNCNLSEYKANLLHNYVCTLHPKD